MSWICCGMAPQELQCPDETCSESMRQRLTNTDTALATSQARRVLPLFTGSRSCGVRVFLVTICITGSLIGRIGVS
jgi:hypothetical protein